LVATLPWQETAEWLRSDTSPAAVEALEFIFDSPYIRTSDMLGRFAVAHFPSGRPLGEAALALTQAIHREFKYDPKATTIDTSVEEVLERRRGVCQDFAHLAIACLRSLGLACRYVSGYLRTDPQPGQPRLMGADASHAWISVYSPDAGWIDLDPTNGCVVSDRHITLGWGRDFHDVSPVKGSVLGGGESTLRVAVDVEPL
jgi:transglutaminase-like putative cysteine protease